MSPEASGRAPVDYVAVAGTWAWKGGAPTPESWWTAGSAFAQYAAARGARHLAPHRPFVWSTALAGVPSWQVWRRPDSRQWEAAGYALYAYCVPPTLQTYRPVRLLTHSHGLQVALWACALGLQVEALVDVCGPVREDMQAVAAAARPRIGRWLHIYSDRSDTMQVLGGLFDGRLGVSRAHPLAENAPWPGVGHSRLLHDPTLFPVWEEQGWLAYLTQSR